MKSPIASFLNGWMSFAELWASKKVHTWYDLDLFPRRSTSEIFVWLTLRCTQCYSFAYRLPEILFCCCARTSSDLVDWECNYWALSSPSSVVAVRSSSEKNYRLQIFIT